MKTERNPVDILLVEDSPADIRLTREVLKEGKVCNNLHIVMNGEDAMDFLHRRGKYSDAVRPNLILLDLNLPRKDGRQVLAEIKSDAALKSIPVIVMTTSQAEEDIARSYDLHVNCYISKPVDLERFIDVVKSIDRFWFSIVSLPPRNGSGA